MKRGPIEKRYPTVTDSMVKAAATTKRMLFRAISVDAEYLFSKASGTFPVEIADLNSI
jgi:hypothetical protein